MPILNYLNLSFIHYKGFYSKIVFYRCQIVFHVITSLYNFNGKLNIGYLIHSTIQLTFNINDIMFTCLNYPFSVKTVLVPIRLTWNGFKPR